MLLYEGIKLFNCTFQKAKLYDTKINSAVCVSVIVLFCDKYVSGLR